MRNEIIETLASDIFKISLAVGLAVGVSVAVGVSLVWWVVV
ncbi:MAG: hypothetical protein R3F06_16365 [Nitrosomonas sp.]